MDLLFVRNGSVIHGPYTPSVLRGLTARGRFGADCLVSENGITWTPLTGPAIADEPAMPAATPVGPSLAPVHQAPVHPAAIGPTAIEPPPSSRALGWVLAGGDGWLRWVLLGAAIAIIVSTFLPFGSLTHSDRRGSETVIAFFWSDIGGRGALIAIGSILSFATGVFALLAACLPHTGLRSRPASWTLGCVAMGTALLLLIGCLIASSGGHTNSSVMDNRWGKHDLGELLSALDATAHSGMISDDKVKVTAEANALRMGLGSLFFSFGLPPTRIVFAVIAGAVLLAASSGFLAAIARTTRSQMAWSIVILSCATTFVVGAIVSLASAGLSHASWITQATVGLVAAGAVIAAGVLTILSPAGRRPLLRRIAWHLVAWSLVGVLASALLAVPLILLIGGHEASWSAFNALIRTWQFTGLLMIAALATYTIFAHDHSQRQILR